MGGLIGLGVIIGIIWLEIIVFGWVGHHIGVGLTIIGVFVTAVIGLRLFKMEGQTTLRRMVQSVAKGEPPVVEVANGVAILLGAGLLLIPGYATDALGFLLFIPHLRVLMVTALFLMAKKMGPNINLDRRFGFAFTQNASSPKDAPKDERYNLDEDAPTHDDASGVTIEGEYKREK